MTDQEPVYGEFAQRDRSVHPPPYAPTYKTTVLRSPRKTACAESRAS